MKMNLFNCPLCGSHLEQAGNTLVCSCGWNALKNPKRIRAIQRAIAKGILGLGVVLMAVFVYVGMWGASSLSIIPLKAQVLSGTLKQSSFDRLKDICMGLKRYDCVEGAFRSYYKSSSDIELLGQLAEFQYRRRATNRSMESFYQYFSKKGRSLKVAYTYGKLLEEQNQSQKALEYYKYALSLDTSSIQVSVMRRYIGLLVKMGQKSKAVAELQLYGSKIDNASQLVKQEFSRWNQLVANSGVSNHSNHMGIQS